MKRNPHSLPFWCCLASIMTCIVRSARDVPSFSSHSFCSFPLSISFHHSWKKFPSHWAQMSGFPPPLFLTCTTRTSRASCLPLLANFPFLVLIDSPISLNILTIHLQQQYMTTSPNFPKQALFLCWVRSESWHEGEGQEKESKRKGKRKTCLQQQNYLGSAGREAQTTFCRTFWWGLIEMIFYLLEPRTHTVTTPYVQSKLNCIMIDPKVDPNHIDLSESSNHEIQETYATTTEPRILCQRCSIVISFEPIIEISVTSSVVRIFGGLWW